ncbi:MAG TPA: MFS transporter [Anaerolineae bacterium]|nr:MFS transporter [Anaerolineae bacterium]HOQ98392.1 MFS transporter [Anaerolineae bacterium]HPL26496.1 MFS transporter [Anaerolineae bacterium]
MKRLRWHEYITHNIYWFALSMGSGSLTPLIMPLLVQQFVEGGQKNTFYGLLRASGLAVAILVQPAAGLLSDRCTSRWGRRRPFIAVGALLTALLVLAMAAARSFWALFGIMLVMQFATNIAHGALQGIIPDMTPEDQRGRASAAKSLLDLAPTLVVAFTIAPLVKGGDVSAAIVALAAVYVVAMLITVVGVREVPLRDVPAGDVGAMLLRTAGLLLGVAAGAAVAGLAALVCGGLAYLVALALAGAAQARLVGVGVGGLVGMLGTIVAGVWAAVHLGTGDARRHASFTWWVVNRLAFMAAVGSILSFALYFLQDVLRLPNPAQVTANLQAAAGALTLVLVLVSGFLADRFGRRPLVVVGGLVAALGTCLLLAAGNVTLVLIAGCTIGAGTGLFYTASWALGTDLVPAGEAGRFLGIQNVAGAGAGIVGAGLGGLLADYFNRASAGSGYLVIFAMYGACFLLSAGVMAWVREPAAVAVQTTK